MLQGAVPDLAYTDPGDGKERMVEVRFISQCPSRYSRQVATSLRASVNERGQLLYQEYLTRLRLIIFKIGIFSRHRDLSDGTVAVPDLT